ncbi:hypothetical protein HK105_203304 [Polyrhizophydium stewartii]|uniref:Uncharacterized protein n=1 Tax=Polyrhizophydium stewartii TaxID=2732419 RepID=A0ABR4NCS7_9FUNG
MYIRKHPEIKDIMSYFAREVLVNRPANVSEFAASVFADPELRQNVDRFKQQLDESRKLTDLG